MSLQVNCIKVESLVKDQTQNEWTQYDVTDQSGTVQVAAAKRCNHPPRRQAAQNILGEQLIPFRCRA